MLKGNENLMYKICISQNTTILVLDNRFCLSKRATCFDLHIGHFQAHTIPKGLIEEDNV